MSCRQCSDKKRGVGTPFPPHYTTDLEQKKINQIIMRFISKAFDRFEIDELRALSQ